MEDSNNKKTICSVEAIDFFKNKILKIFLKCVIIFLAITIVTALIVRMIGLDRIASVFARALNSTMEPEDSADAIMTWYDFLLHNGEANLVTVLAGLIPFISVTASEYGDLQYRD